MALTLVLFILSTGLSLSLADYNSDNDLILAIKSIKETFQHDVDVLKERLNDQERINSALKETIQDKDIEYGQKMSVLEERLINVERKNDVLSSENNRNKLKIKFLTQKLLKDGNDTHQSITRRAFDDGNVAFTAYLDHDVDHIGQTQTIPFNRVILNYGNAYNNVTNVFTAPIDGVYSFTFFIGQRDPNEAQALLFVNNKHQVGAAVETLHDYQDSQGGNSANLLLQKGDTVYVTHRGGGAHVEGTDALRTTTFSGFLLFPVEALSLVG